MKRVFGAKIFFACGALKRASPRGMVAPGPKLATHAVPIIPVTLAVGVRMRGYVNGAPAEVAPNNDEHLALAISRRHSALALRRSS